MEYVIYIDVFFFVNLLMDFIVLLFSKKFLKVEATKFKCFLGAIVGAAQTTVIYVITNRVDIELFIVEYVLIVLMMNQIAFRYRGIAAIIRGFASTYLVTFMIGGILNALYYHTYFGVIVHRTINGFFCGDLSLISFISFTLITYGIMSFFSMFIGNRNKKKAYTILNVKLRDNDTVICLKGLYDTGNRLKDPISGDDVHLISKEIIRCHIGIENLFDISLKPRMIPFTSIGGEGMVNSVIVHEMIVEDDEGNILKELHNARIGILEDKFFENKEYKIILNRSLEL